MRKYLFGTGIIGAITSGLALLRGTKDEEITWRTVLAWLSWLITLALAVGSIVDIQRAARGKLVAADSPASRKQIELMRKRIKG